MAATPTPSWTTLVAVAAVAVVCSLSGAVLESQPVPLSTLRGRVSLVDEPTAERPTTRSLGTSELKPGSERRRAVVFLTLPNGILKGATTPTRATMDQRGETFVPRVLAIPVGSTVDFPNSDPTYHNVFSLSRTKSFDLGRYPAGRTKAVRFDRPGIVRVFCDIHSHMSASILVFAHAFYDVTGNNGTYRISDVPPGSYVVNAWMENRATQSRPITISAGGGETEVDFAFDRRGAR